MLEPAASSPAHRRPQLPRRHRAGHRPQRELRAPRSAAGRLAFVAQSGALATAVLDWATARGIGFSHVVSLGDMADVDFGDMLDYLARDPRRGRSCSTSRRSPTRASSCPRRGPRARIKPVIVIKAGRTPRARAPPPRIPARWPAPTPSTTPRSGAPACCACSARASCSTPSRRWPRRSPARRPARDPHQRRRRRRAGDRRADRPRRPARRARAGDDRRARRLLPADLVARQSGRHPRRRAGSSATPRRSTSSADNGVDGVLVMNCPTAVASPEDAAQAVAEVARQAQAPAGAHQLARRRRRRGVAAAVRRAGIPTYDTPEEAVGASCTWSTTAATRSS